MIKVKNIIFYINTSEALSRLCIQILNFNFYDYKTCDTFKQ